MKYYSRQTIKNSGEKHEHELGKHELSKPPFF